MSKGKLYEKCVDLQKGLCIHAPEEDEDGNITQKIHNCYNHPSTEQIKQTLDEAKDKFPLKICNGMMIVDTRETQVALKLDEIGKWFIEYFGEN